VGDRLLRGQEREAFEILLNAILQADRNYGKDVNLQPQVIEALVRSSKSLNLNVTFTFECPGCGEVLAQCANCRLPHTAKYDDDILLVECLGCRGTIEAGDSFQCECGGESAIIALENHLNMFPAPELIAALADFIAALDDVHWEGVFCIHGNVLKVMPLPSRPPIGRINLSELSLWRTRARYHFRHEPCGERERQIRSILNNLREKCSKNNFHPTRAECDHCLASSLSFQDVQSNGICLPRLIGMPIERSFDGIHHAHEIADVQYQDTVDDTDQAVRLAIHLKSHTRSRGRAVGRSVHSIQALYTQLFYSAYAALSERVDFDVIGIAIPNKINTSVIESMQRLLNDLGFSFLVVDETEWLKIVDATLEQLQFEPPATT